MSCRTKDSTDSGVETPGSLVQKTDMTQQCAVLRNEYLFHLGYRGSVKNRAPDCSNLEGA